MALPLTFLYPPATQPGGFSFDARSVKIARHSNCSACDCQGWHPPEGCAVVINNGSAEAQAALDEAEESTEVTEEGFWRMCACGDGIEDHGNGLDVGQDEIERRARVAIRIDEILEDKGLLSDFIAPLSDPDVRSLRKQMVPFDETQSRTSGDLDISPPSSPASNRSSSSSALSPPPEKLRKAAVPDPYSSDEDEVPLAAAVPRQASEDSGYDIEDIMDLDLDPEPEPPRTSPTKGGKSAASQPGMHKTVAAMGPAALPVDAPVKQESARVEPAVPVDDRQIARLATGAAVDVDAFTEPIVVKPKPALLLEQKGTIRFEVVSNDGTPTSMILLTGLKTLFQKQLPKMPREYIARLVYDRSSKGMAIIKRGLRVVGGITFRPFPQRGFAEIVFFAISSVHQVAGFGAHLMNKFKMYIREHMPTIEHFLTYADNFAIGYFKKQGFTKEITLPRSVWMGYIKDYEGGTIMQCSLIPQIDYLSVQELLAKQKQAIIDRIRAKSHAHVIHPGLTHFRSGGTTSVDYREVPGLKESGWTPEMDEIIRMPARGPHHSTMEAMLKEMRGHAAAWPFQKPVNTDEVKDYLEVVKKPMDLSMMEFKLENNAYAGVEEFVDDAKLMLDNCKLYNPETTVYHKTAIRMEKAVQDILKSVGVDVRWVVWVVGFRRYPLDNATTVLPYQPCEMEQPLHAMPRHDDDEIEGELSYLPGSGPSLDPDYFDPHAAPPGFVTAFWNPYEVKHRRRTSRAQLGVLETEFDKDPKPNADKRRSLAAQLNMTPRAIQVWFQNRRAKIKAIKNKIPGGRGMPKLKPGEKAALRANRNLSDEKKDDKADWVELSPEESPLTSPGDGAFSPDKPQFTIATDDSPPPSAVSEAPSPAVTAQNDLLAPPSAAAMLRRGSAPAPLQGIHRARYSVFNRPEDTIPASPISPPDHQVAPVRRASASHVGLGRRPSLPDSHLKLSAHPYYPHASAPRMQRRGGLLSPVPDVGQEQEQQYSIPTMLPPAPTVGSSRMYRALPPGMGAVPAAHDLPTQFPARPGVYGSSSSSGSYAPARPFAVPVAGPLPAPDFSFGAPEPGHGDAFNRATADDPAPVSATSEYGPDFNQPEYDYQSSNPDFGNTLWDRTRFGSMASIASDVTGVSVSSTQATSISSGDRLFGYPGGFQPDVRRASCPGEFLHQFSGMGVGPNQNEVAGPTPIRPSPLGRSLTIAPDSRLVQDAKSLHSPTFPPGHVDPTFPPPPPQEHVSNGQHMSSNPHLPLNGQCMPSNQHMSNQHMPSNNQHMPSNNQHMPSNNQHMQSNSQHMPSNGQHMPSNQHMSSNGQLHMSPTEMSSNQHQRSLVGGGFGSEPYLGYDSRTPPSFDSSPNMAGVDVLGNVDMGNGVNVDMMNNSVVMNTASVDMMGNGMPPKEPMLFNADGPYDLNVMPMIGQGYTGEFNF